MGFYDERPSTYSLADVLKATPNIQNYPVAPPPPGVVADFNSPSSNVWKIYLTVGICLTAILVFSVCRLYVKVAVIKRFSRDDYFFLLALSSGIAWIMLVVAMGYQRMYGVHTYNLRIGDLTANKLRILCVAMLFYNPVVFFIKVTLLLFYLEVLGSLRWLRWCVWIGVVVYGLCCSAFFISTAVICVPRTGTGQMEYLATIMSPTCQLQGPLSLVQAAVNMSSDLVLLVVPMPAIWGLKTSIRKKIGISAIIATGIA